MMQHILRNYCLIFLAVVSLSGRGAIGHDLSRAVAPRHSHGRKHRGLASLPTASPPKRRSLKGSTKKSKGSKSTPSTKSPKNSKSTKTDKSSSGKGGSKKGSKSKKMSENIFEHSRSSDVEDLIEKEEVQVQCGTDESPFLTTFVASIRLRPPRYSFSQDVRRKKSGSYDANNDDDYNDEKEEVETLPTATNTVMLDALTFEERQILSDTFREVYNNWTFNNCDGFFRTVYTVSMTMVERDEKDDEYAVTFENNYVESGDEVREDAFIMRVVNGTANTIEPPSMESDTDSDFDMDEQEDHAARWLQQQQNNSFSGVANITSIFATPTKEGSSDEYGVSTKDQTVVGGPNLPIYYVSLACTCRNCAVNDDVNFPLLMLPDEEEKERRQRRRKERILQATTPSAMPTPAPMPTLAPATVPPSAAPSEKEEVCTCMLPVDDGELEVSRRHRYRRFLQDLFVPQPMGPTAYEFIQAMNDAIQGIQERDDKLLRIEGIVDLMEPDYFNRENPELVGPQPTTPTPPSTTTSVSPSVAPSTNPTTSALTRAPTLPPTLPPITPAPTSAVTTADSGAPAACWSLVMTLSSSLLCLALSLYLPV